MTNLELQMMNFKDIKSKKLVLFCLFVLLSWFSFSQVKASIDSISIKIGAQVTYKIEVDTDTTALGFSRRSNLLTSGNDRLLHY